MTHIITDHVRPHPAGQRSHSKLISSTFIAFHFDKDLIRISSCSGLQSAFAAQYLSNKEKRSDGGHGWATTKEPTIHGLGGPIRCIVGASGERMRGVGPCGRPSEV